MTFTPWNTAHGEAAPAWLQVSSTVALSPADDSVDTNTVVIQGAGTILSFGDCSYIVLKRVKFAPLVMAGHIPPGGGGGGGGGAVIELVNSPQLNLLSGQRRSINDEAYGMYFCPGDNHWNEVYFVQKGTASAFELEGRIADFESRLSVLESKVST
jgi:hypothetical protein